MNRLLLLYFSTALFMPLPGLAETIHVPGDYPTIQQAINHAQPGDTVLVASGTYEENLTFLGKEITICSEEGPEATIIDGGNSGSVVRFRNGEGPGAVLEGFTLTNGSGTYVPYKYRGGGIYCEGASPTITNNVIEGNTADWGGGICCFSGAKPLIQGNIITNNSSGIHCNGSTPVITMNTISNNIYTGVDFQSGYAMITYNVISGNGQSGIEGGGPGEITGNVITNNFEYWRGGGIYWGGIGMVIRDNIIAGNTTYNFGGGIYFTTGDVVIENNRIFQNTGGGIGGAIECIHATLRFAENTVYGNTSDRGAALYMGQCDAVLYDNIIHHNTADKYGGGIYGIGSTVCSVNDTYFANTAMQSGGGFYGGENASLTLVNTVLWNNTAPVGPAMTLSKEGTNDPSSAAFSFCDVEGGKSSVQVDPGCTLTWGPGMIDADPLFAEPSADDFHLTHPSPCREAGDDTAVVGTLDFEGDPRIAGGGVDLGADEFHLHLYATGDAVPGGTVTLKIVDTPGTAPVFLWAGSGVLDPPLTLEPYGDWYLAPPLLFEASLSPIPGPDGIFPIPVQIPGSVPTPLKLPLQAFSGSALTNLYMLEIE